MALVKVVTEHVLVKYLKDSGLFVVGSTIAVSSEFAKDLVESGIVELVSEGDDKPKNKSLVGKKKLIKKA